LTKPLTYNSSFEQHKRMFACINPPVKTQAVCHVWRKEEARGACESGVTHDQIEGAGHWRYRMGVMDNFYLDSALKLEFIRHSAGFPTSGGFYHINRDVLSPNPVRVLSPC
jgi:hypothetical protein